jgi:Glycosyl hydrolase family 1
MVGRTRQRCRLHSRNSCRLRRGYICDRQAFGRPILILTRGAELAGTTVIFVTADSLPRNIPRRTLSRGTSPRFCTPEPGLNPTLRLGISRSTSRLLLYFAPTVKAGPNRTPQNDSYLKFLARASQDGVPVTGYFHCSLLDNFKWNQGFAPRFGLIYVDYKSQKRILKDSAEHYTEIIRSNGSTLSPEPALTSSAADTRF